MQVWNVTLNRRENPASSKVVGRIALEQRLRVGMSRLEKDAFDIAVLDDLAGVHDDHLVAEFGDQPEIVRDDHHRTAMFGLNLSDQVDDLCLHCHVEGGGRLIGDQQAGGQ